MRDGISIWYAEKHKRWIFQVTYRDFEGRRVTKQRRAKTRTEAERRAIDLSRSPGLSTKKNPSVTFAALLNQYQQEQQYRIRPSSLANSIHLIRLYFLPALSSYQLEKITPDLVERLLRDLQKKGLRANSINTARAKLHALIAFAVGKGYVSSNPVSKVRPFRSGPAEQTQVQKPWSLQEAKSALAVFAGTELDIFLIIALSTGMRKGEILALRWGDVDFQLGTIQVSKSRSERRVLNHADELTTQVVEGEAKTKSSMRTLRISRRLSAALQTLSLQRFGDAEPPSSEHIILGRNGKPLAPSRLSRIFRKELLSANLRVIRIHDLRHTAAVLALQAKSSIEEVSQGLGHTGVEITKRTYAPVVPALSDRFTDRISKLLFD